MISVPDAGDCFLASIATAWLAASTPWRVAQPLVNAQPVVDAPAVPAAVRVRPPARASAPAVARIFLLSIDKAFRLSAARPARGLPVIMTCRKVSGSTQGTRVHNRDAGSL